MCELSLSETGLARKPGAEITSDEFEAVWVKHGGAPWQPVRAEVATRGARARPCDPRLIPFPVHAHAHAHAGARQPEADLPHTAPAQAEAVTRPPPPPAARMLGRICEKKEMRTVRLELTTFGL